MASTLDLDSLLPFLIRQSEQKKKEKRKKERGEKITSSLSRLEEGIKVPFSIEENRRQVREAQANLIQEGAAPRAGTVEDIFRSKADLDEYFNIVKAPDWVVQGYKSGDFTRKEAMSFARKKGDQVPVTIEETTWLVNNHPSFEGQDPQQLLGEINIMSQLSKSGIPADQINQLFKRDKNDENLVIQTVFDIVDTTPGKLSREDFSAKQWDAISKRFGTKEKRDAFLRNDYDTSKMIKAGSDVIETEKNLTWGLTVFGFDKDLAKWTEGTLKGKEKVKYFDKFYNKNGTRDWGAIALAGQEAFQSAEAALSDKGQKAEDLPADIREDVLGYINAGYTKKQLQAFWDEAKNSGQPLLMTEEKFNRILEFIDD